MRQINIPKKAMFDKKFKDLSRRPGVEMAVFHNPWTGNIDGIVAYDTETQKATEIYINSEVA